MNSPHGQPPRPPDCSIGGEIAAIEVGKESSGHHQRHESAQKPVPSPTAAGSNDSAETERPFLWLRRGDQLFVGVLIAIAFILIGWHWLKLRQGVGELVEIDRLPASKYEYRIDINTATWVEWAQFDGIGETLARRIVEDRETNGRFGSIDDVLRVKGIGPKKLEEMRPFLTIKTE